jgi:hypothetical protein
MTTTERAAFLALIGPRNNETLQKTLDRVEGALDAIEQGTAAGSILNVEFKDAKLVLDRAVEGAWNYGRGSKLAPLPQDIFAPEHKDLYTLHLNVSVSYVRDAIATSKKLAKTTVQHPWVDSARAFVATVLPLAVEMEALKAHIVKGRRPPTPEVLAERAAKAAAKNSMPRAQCGCCFGTQAIFEDGTIHDHGYRKPRAWMKQGSCRGWGVPHLAISDKGPKLMVELLNQTEKSLLGHIENLKAATSLKVQSGSKFVNGHHVPEFTDIGVDHPDFERTKAYRIRETEHNLAECRADRKVFEKVVAEWKPGYQYEG